mgnify:CR=1 FL=1
MHLSSASADLSRIANFAVLPWQGCFFVASFLLNWGARLRTSCGALTLTALTGCWPSGISSSEQTKNAVKTALKAAVKQNYNLVENKALSVNARAILEAYLKEVEAGYTHVFEPQNVTNIWPTDVTVGDDEFGTTVFSMPENAVDPQAWKRAANALVANFLYYYQYNGNTVEYCVEIVKQEAADGQGEAADYMVIFAKKHDGEEGGEIWTPPAL